MTIHRRIFLGLLGLTFAAFGLVGAANATSANTDASDVWNNKDKGGTGYLIVNTGTFMFVTGYLYRDDRQSSWITGQLQRTAASPPTFTGPLYVTTGPPFGGPYDATTVQYRQAGTMTFVLMSVTTAELTYSIDGVAADEPLQRTKVTFDDYDGTYSAVLTQTTFSCFDPTYNGTVTTSLDLTFSHDGTAATIQTATADGVSCTISGTYSQRGRMGQVAGTYSCNTGEVGDITVFEMSNVPYMFTARIQTDSTNNGCKTDAEVAAVIPR